MRVLVTGANGFVGANLVRALLKERDDVRAMVRPHSDLKNLEHVHAERVVGDVRDLDSLVRAAEGCHTVFHVAGIYSYSGHRPEELMDVATAGTANALQAAKSARVRRFVLTSSSVVLGSTERPVVLHEKSLAPVAEPGVYANSKIRQEAVAFRRAEELGVYLVAVCPTVCVGANDQGLSESNAIILNYLKDPFRATWPGGCNIVSVDDVARGHILAARAGKNLQRYVLGSENLRWSEVHQVISELTGIRGPLMNASHTVTFWAAVMEEILSRISERRPLVTRAQARMVGRYYWYSHERAEALGYRPMPARQAIAKAISWLAASHHVSPSLRSGMTLSREVYDQR